MRPFALLPVVAVAAGCGLVKVQGFGSGSANGAPSGAGAGAASSAPGAPQSLALSPTSANPTVIRDMHAVSEAKPEEMWGTKNCYYPTTKRPVAVLAVEQPVKQLKVSARGAGAVVVKMGDKVSCNMVPVGGMPSVTVAAPAGSAEVYVGQHQVDQPIDFVLTIEDLDRPAVPGWSTNTSIARIRLDGLPKEANVFTPALAKGARDEEGACDNAYFREQPDLVLELTKPLADLRLSARGPESAHVLLIGPVTADGRNVKKKCSETSGDVTWPRLEPGVYAVKVGGRQAAPPTFLNVVVTAKGAIHNPAKPAASIPDKLPLMQRDLLLHFPQVRAEDVFDDVVRAGLFAAAPAGLFVFPKHDLDKTTATFVRWSSEGEGEPWPSHDAPTVEFPKTGEPLLVVGRRVLTSDGLLFDVKEQDLAEAPSGPAAFPTAARNPHSSFVQALAAHGKDEESVYTQWNKTQEIWDKCSQATGEPFNQRLRALEEQLPTEERSRQISAVRDEAARVIDQKCNAHGFDDKKKKTWEQLVKTRTSRRTESLAAAKKRLSSAWK